ncbi:MAG: hypothetical protein FWG22_03175 [Prolixibacteraceae bacterium]|nr:hypothetical protein [Prolixibacteraceae bacterium]
MKNLLICLMMITFLCSCQRDVSETQDGGIASEAAVMDFIFKFVFVDENLQDRLNPESPAYFGKEYVQGIKLLDGKKNEFDPYEYHNSVRSIHEAEETLIQFPYRWYAGNKIDQNTFGYFFIHNPLVGLLGVNGNLACYYIHYPDGSEDAIKVRELCRSGKYGSVHTYSHIWINEDLVFELGGASGRNYYNPQYYLWLAPVFDDNGAEIAGERPGACYVIALTK